MIELEERHIRTLKKSNASHKLFLQKAGKDKEMKKDYMAILNLEENENDIRGLTAYRPIATIPIGGRYRVIDFMLSNFVNAGLKNIAVFVKKNTRSLIDHIGTGKPWDLNRKHGGLFMFDHSMISYNNYDLKMFGNNIEFLNRNQASEVIIASSYMICNLDMEQIIDAHEESGNDISIVYKRVDNADRYFLNCACLNIDNEKRVVSISKNIGFQKENNICMEIFLMKKPILLRLIYMAVQQGYFDDFNNFLYNHIGLFRTGAIEFTGFLSCINSISSYYDTNMSFLNRDIMRELFTADRPVYTKTKDSPPAHYLEGSHGENSLIADGSIIKGTVRDSVIARSAVIDEGVELDHCIILQGASIHEGAQLSHVIVEKGVNINAGTQIVGTADFPIVIENKITSSFAADGLDPSLNMRNRYAGI